jgi:hypothetical protein
MPARSRDGTVTKKAELTVDLERLKGMAETKRVRVSYESTGHGLALMIAGPDTAATDDRYQDGVLRISDACVTLELPAADGRASVLAWDPAEVDWRSWTDAVPA